MLIDVKGSVRSKGVPFSGQNLTESVFHTNTKTLYSMRLSHTVPFFHDQAILVDNLNMRTFQRLTVCNVDHVNLNMRQSIFNQNHAVPGHVA